MRSLYLLLLLSLMLPLSSLAQDTTANFPIKRVGSQISFPYGFGLATAKATPEEFLTIALQPGEKLVDHSRDTRLIYRYGNRLSHGQLQQLFHIKPSDYGMKAYIYLKSNQRSYYILLQAPAKEELGGGQSGSFAKEIAFYYPSDSVKSSTTPPRYMAEVARQVPRLEDDPQIQSPAQPATTTESSSESLTYDWRSGRYSFPWKPEAMYSSQGKFILKAPQEIEKEGVPVLYAIEGEDKRREVPFSYDPSTRTIIANTAVSRGVLVYEFYYPGPFGIGKRTGEKQLFITLQNEKVTS